MRAAPERNRAQRLPVRRVGRLDAWAALAASAALLACAPETEPYPAPPARNAVLIVIDTLRADALSLHGYPRPTTPFLDRWASERGVVFDAARSSAPWTKPAVAALLTGLEAPGHGVQVHTDRLHIELRRLPQVFAEAGFQTAAVQSNPLVSSLFGYQAGFDVFHDEHLARHDVSTGEDIHAQAVRWLREERDPARPFFLFLQHYEPHFAYLRDGEQFADAPYTGTLRGDEPMDQLIAGNAMLAPADVAYLRSRYDAEIRYQDSLVERLWRELEALGLDDDTLVVFTADHGEEFHEHGELSHQHKLFDELLRVPLVFARPGEPAPGRHLLDPVSTTDVGRTMLDLVGLEGAPFPGKSLAGRIAGATLAERPVFSQVRTLRPLEPSGEEGEVPAAGADSGPDGSVMHALDGVVFEGWKLVSDPGTGERSLFDLERDPGELHDLAAEEPDRIERLSRVLERWLSTEYDVPELGEDRVELTESLRQQLEDLGYF